VCVLVFSKIYNIAQVVYTRELILRYIRNRKDNHMEIQIIYPIPFLKNKKYAEKQVNVYNLTNYELLHNQPVVFFLNHQ